MPLGTPNIVDVARMPAAGMVIAIGITMQLWRVNTGEMKYEME